MHQIAEDIRSAAALIQTDGWARDQFHDVVDGRVCHCAEGALMVATGYHNPVIEGGRVASFGTDMTQLNRLEAASHAIQRYINACRPELTNVIRFNDNVAESADDVVELLLAAAEWVEAQA
jgi:hypothetical protein